MSIHIQRDDSLFIPIKGGMSIADSQGKIRMYKSKEAFERHFPGHRINKDSVELVEFARVRHGRWIHYDGNYFRCSNCRLPAYIPTPCWGTQNFCPTCGAKMDLEEVSNG